MPFDNHQFKSPLRNASKGMNKKRKDVSQFFKQI